MSETVCHPTHASDRIRPLQALRALRALIRNPDDTARVFDVIEALSGRTRSRLFHRFLESASGQRLLADRPDLLAQLSNREQLFALPAGTSARLREFMTREQISADGLVDASETWSRDDLPPTGAGSRTACAMHDCGTS